MPLAHGLRVPTLEHNLVIDLLSRADLLRRFLPPHTRKALARATSSEIVSAELSQLTPTEYRADLVTVFRDAAGQALLAVIVEVQRQIDPDKALAWPIYVTAARQRLGCPVLLMVIALDARVAAWAKGPFATGHPGFALRPLVVSRRQIPARVSPQTILKLPELGVLSVLAHPTLPAALAALRGLSTLRAEQSQLYFDVILDALPDAIRQALEDSMQHHEYRSDFARRYVAEGRAEGKLEGRAEGKLEGKQAAAIELARAKLGPLSSADEAAIGAIADMDQLTALIIALGLARDPDEAQAALRRHGAPSPAR